MPDLKSKAPAKAATLPALGEQLTLIDPPEFSAILPTPNTLPERLLWVLLAGASVSHEEHAERTGSWRAAAAVHLLRELGWPIATERIPAPTEEAPQRCIARYRLPADAIAAGLELLTAARGGA